MHGLGNDYIFIDARNSSFAVKDENLGALAEKLSNRNCSIGGDGLVIIQPSETADCRMRIFNADGSEGKTCGNALRCIAVYLGKGGGYPLTFSVETACGTVKACVFEKNYASVEMGVAEFSGKDLPPVSTFAMPYGEREFVFCPVSVGNPHAVCFADDFDFDLSAVAKELSDSDIFPCGVNVEFAIPLQGELNMRVIERGSGETLCCGSGACAVAAAACKRGLKTNGKLKINCLGGSVYVNVGEDYSLTLLGKAEYVFKGEIEIE